MAEGDVKSIPSSLLESAEKNLRRGQYEEAWPQCELLMASEASWWRAHAVSGRVLLEWGKATEDSGRLKRAVNRFDEALVLLGRVEHSDLTFDLSELLNDKGVALYELDEMGGACAAFEETLTVWPEHERALCNMGLIHWIQEHTSIALSFFDRAIAAAGGTNPHSLNNRGALRLDVLGGEEGALAALPDFHAAVALDPYYDVAIRNRDGALTTLNEPVPMTAVVEFVALST